MGCCTGRPPVLGCWLFTGALYTGRPDGSAGRTTGVLPLGCSGCCTDGRDGVGVTGVGRLFTGLLFTGVLFAGVLAGGVTVAGLPLLNPLPVAGVAGLESVLTTGRYMFTVLPLFTVRPGWRALSILAGVIRPPVLRSTSALPGPIS